MTAPRNPLAGIALVLAAVACFAILDTATKVVTLAIPLMMGQWFRYAFQAVATTALVLPQQGLGVLRTQHPGLQFLRGLLLWLCSVFAFSALRYMPVGEFTAIVMVTPLVITLLASRVLKEDVSALRWLLVGGGFAGTLIIIRPGDETFGWASLLPIGLVITNAWFQVLTSKMARTENPVTMHLYTGWVGTGLSTLFLPFVWQTPPNALIWGLMVLMGFCATLGHFMLILAYQRAPATTLTPYIYAQIAFAMLGGWIAFSHVPDGWSMLGMLMIGVCGVGAAWLTVRQQRERLAATTA